MVHIYPRNRKEIIAINGIFDPCQDTTEMSELWTLAGLGWWASGGYGLNWTQVSAPGAIGGYAHKLSGKIANGIGMFGVQGISPWKNTGYNHYFAANNSFYWKMKAEFRMRIEEDQTNAASGNCSHSIGFCLDGNVMHWAATPTAAGVGNTMARISVVFNVTDSLIAIVNRDFPNAAEIVDSDTWSGSYDTWYDVRIEWSHNWYADPNIVAIEVFVNNVSIYQYDLPYPTHWRSRNHPDLSQHSFMGRCGPAIYLENDGGATNLTNVIGYFKDILITQECRVINWKAEDSIIQQGKASSAKVEITSNYKSQFGEGADLRIWKRLKLADSWASRFRGVVREVDPKERKHVLIEAEGYESILFEEKTDNVSYTTQTAGTIVADAINNPDKGEFDVSTYFDVTTNTYSREYMHTKKMSIIAEMASLERFILLVDWRNNWHFESYRTNQLSNHLIWGQSRITEINVSDLFVRKPNKIRVIGKGFTAEREISVNVYSSGSEVIRDINRLDLNSQALVDAALDSYIAEVRVPIKSVMMELRADHSLKKGYLIRVTSPMHGLQNQQFLITSIKCTRTNRMTLSLLEVKPLTTSLISDTIKRVDIKESEMYPSEYIAANDVFNLEGEATVLINGTYEIEYAAAVVQTGKVVITDELMDDLVELWNNESPTQPTYLGYGTGTTEPLFSDTALETESARSAVTATRSENVGNSTTPIYRTVEYSIIVASPSNITEMGLFNAAASGTMDCRAVFASYSQAGSVTFRIKLTVIPVPGYAYLTINGVKKINDWLYNGATMTATHISHCGFRGFTAPTPYSFFVSSAILWPGGWWIPDLAADGTFTKSKLYDRNMMKYVFDYPDYDVTEGGGIRSGDGTQQERFVALQNPHTVFYEYEQYLICLMHRSQNDDDDFEDFSCKWIIWLRFLAGEVEYGN